MNPAPAPKRLRGSGRIFERVYPTDRKVWWIAYYVNGREHRESGGSERAALKLLQRRLGETAAGTFVDPATRKATYRDLEALLVADYEANQRRSLVNARYRLARLKDFFHEVRASEIGFAMANSYVATRRKEGASGATLQYELKLLRRMLALGLRAGKVRAIPPLPSVSVSNARTGFCTSEQIESVLQHLPAHLQPAVLALFLTGWRSQEILGLTWQRVDFEAGILGLEVGESKTGKARVFPFSAMPALAEILRQQRDATKALERAEGRIIPWVFHVDGGRIGSFRKAWTTAVKAAGLPGLRPHDLRRSAARNLIRAGVPEGVVMKLCGWTTRSMLDRYAVSSTQDLVEGVERLSAFLDESRTRTKGGRSAASSDEPAR